MCCWCQDVLPPLRAHVPPDQEAPVGPGSPGRVLTSLPSQEVAGYPESPLRRLHSLRLLGRVAAQVVRRDTVDQ